MDNERDVNFLVEVNSEIRNLYDYCLASGLSHEETVKKASPLLHPIRKETLKRGCYIALSLFAVGLLFGVALTSVHAGHLIRMNIRYALFKLLPWWDWTDFYGSRCLIYNPYFKDVHLMETDCEICEDLYEMDRLSNISSDQISLSYLQNDIPVVVLDAVDDWPAMDDSFNILNLTEGYLYSDEVASQDVCMFQSNLRVQSHHRVFQKIVLENVTGGWYAHWENCRKPTEKFLRKFYGRPYFMPQAVQMTESNWLFMSSSYKGKRYKMVEVLPSISVMWIAQLRGYQHVRFEPKEPCREMCNVLEDILEEGDLAVFTPTLWSFSYLPGDNTENLAIAAGGFSQFH